MQEFFMTTITPRPSNNSMRDARDVRDFRDIRDIRNVGGADKAHWQRITQAANTLRDATAAADAPVFTRQKQITAAKAPGASDISPLAAQTPEQMLATFGRIEMLLDRAVAASGNQKPELELGRTAIAAHVRRMMMLQAGRDGLVGG
jgi:hypothetical protein